MIYSKLYEAKKSGKKQMAILIDPDKANRDAIIAIAELAEKNGISYFFWGGSLVNETQADYYLSLLKAHTNLPIILFPGSIHQLSAQADALLFLQLISGRNPELLIGQHVLAAPRIKKLGLEVMPTSYLYIDGGRPSSVGYMSNTQPIPADKYGIAQATALAGKMLGHKICYMDAGSGALNPISPQMIKAVAKEIGDMPLIIGGGIRSPKQAAAALEAGADLIVIGNKLEDDPLFLPSLSAVIKKKLA